MSTILEFGGAYSAHTGESLPEYVPTCELIDGKLYIDGAHWVSGTGATWHALTGHRSFAFGGASADPIFEPCETATDDQIREWVREAGGDVFAVVEVTACDHDTCADAMDAGGCDNLECDACAEYVHCHDCGCSTEPAGWSVIYRDAE